MSEETSLYTWQTSEMSGYHSLINPTGHQVAMLTEPEDIHPFRDLEDITTELNYLYKKIITLQAEVFSLQDDLKEATERGDKNWQGWLCAENELLPRARKYARHKALEQILSFCKLNEGADEFRMVIDEIKRIIKEEGEIK